MATVNNDTVLPKITRLASGIGLRVVDLFAGCGGMSLGFHKAGYKILGGIEFDPKAVQTHAMNFFGDESSDEFKIHSIPHDITQFPPEKFMREVLKAENPDNLVDVIVGGPPCQSFARIGRAKLREIRQHPEAFLKDERANLYVNFLEYVEFFQPLAVLMENVPDIMNFGGKNVAEEIAVSLEALGYRCKYTILNAAHYGVPQMRQRFFLIAILDVLDVDPHFPQPTHFIELPQGYEGSRQVAMKAINLFNFKDVRYVDPPKLSPTLPRAITAEEAIGDLPPITAHLRGEMKRGAKNFTTRAEYRSNITLSTYAKDIREWDVFEANGGVKDHVTRYLPRDYNLFALMHPGDQYPEVYELAMSIFHKALQAKIHESGKAIPTDSKEFKELKKKIVPPYDPGKFPNKWRKLEADQPVRTLTAHIGKDTYSHIHYDSSQARVISVREAARLQSFPDGFEFTGPMNTAFKQIGNAVPPLFAYALAKHIHSLLYHAKKQVVPLFKNETNSILA